jgi:TPR repeat protein
LLACLPTQAQYLEASKELFAKAERGDAEAQYQLGLKYERYANELGISGADSVTGGREVINQNFAEAVKWWHRAAAQGHKEAQFKLGVSYHNGEGVEKNDAEAVKWWHKAAAQGHSTAQFNLGIRYHQGAGVEKNYAEAAKWYSMAAAQGYELPDGTKKWLEDRAIENLPINELRAKAEQGNATAQFNLGSKYYLGRGVTTNKQEGLAWFYVAKRNGRKDMDKLINAFEPILGPEDTLKAQERSREIEREIQSKKTK